jgi:hypothetical protein
MMAWVIGVGNLLVGAAYVSLGLLSAWEAFSQYETRGLSRFGLGFSLMAASCGPHHLVHGWCALQGGTVSTPLLLITLFGLPAGIVFCWLRIEAMLLGRGDRTVAATPLVVVVVSLVSLGAVGALAGWSVAAPPLPSTAICSVRGIQIPSAGPNPAGNAALLVLGTNLFVTVTYAMVGWYLIETQVRRYVTYRSWSLSGLSLAAVFPTCAAMHMIMALSSSSDTATLPFDLLGVPASVYFLWVVRRLHMDAVVDWNRRPLVGIAAVPSRAAPWSD